MKRKRSRNDDAAIRRARLWRRAAAGPMVPGSLARGRLALRNGGHAATIDTGVGPPMSAALYFFDLESRTEDVSATIGRRATGRAWLATGASVALALAATRSAGTAAARLATGARAAAGTAAAREELER